MDGWRSVSPKTSHVIAIRKIETPRMVARGAGECGDVIFFTLPHRVFIPCGSEAESVSSRCDNRDTPHYLDLYVIATFGPNFEFTTPGIYSPSGSTWALLLRGGMGF